MPSTSYNQHEVEAANIRLTNHPSPKPITLSSCNPQPHRSFPLHQAQPHTSTSPLPPHPKLPYPRKPPLQTLTRLPQPTPQPYLPTPRHVPYDQATPLCTWKTHTKPAPNPIRHAFSTPPLLYQYVACMHASFCLPHQTTKQTMRNRCKCGVRCRK